LSVHQSESYSNIFITSLATDLHVIGTAFSNGYTGAIYSYSDINEQQTLEGYASKRTAT
jgi:hypothetical protein